MTCVHAILGERARHLTPGNLRLGLRGLCFFQTCACSSCVAAANRSQMLLARHVAFGDMVEHRRQDIRKQAKLTDLPHRLSERDADRFLGPGERDQRSIRRQRSTGLRRPRGPRSRSGAQAHPFPRRGLRPETIDLIELAAMACANTAMARSR